MWSVNVLSELKSALQLASLKVYRRWLYTKISTLLNVLAQLRTHTMRALWPNHASLLQWLGGLQKKRSQKAGQLRIAL
eukprot:m.236861 g.236861  ORF g.236861 m.236861 type:complete len:78 (-) comp15788_c0_seq2:62-295(-)